MSFVYLRRPWTTTVTTWAVADSTVLVSSIRMSRPTITTTRRSLASEGAVVPPAKPPPCLYVAATRQHVGKTSVSLALMSGLQRRFEKVGFIKPVGQISVLVPCHNDKQETTIAVDKDAALIHHYFNLSHVPLDCISPLLITSGYTRDFLDGNQQHTTAAHQQATIRRAYQAVCATSDIVLAEGTGHVAVGSIVSASNAQVASWLDASVVLVVNGGLGRSLDELVLNQTLCEHLGVPIAGVIVNHVQHDKYEQTAEYMTKALQHAFSNDNIPLLGCIPDRPFLGCPALQELRRLLDGTLVAGQQHGLRHFRVPQDLHIVACSLEAFLQRLRNQRVAALTLDAPETTTTNSSSRLLNERRSLYVCHASRNDIMLAFLMEAVQHNRDKDAASSNNNNNNESAMVVTGCADHPISKQVLEMVAAMSANAPPVLVTPHGTDEALRRMYGYTPKLNRDDPRRVATAIDHYEPYIDFDLLLRRIGVSGHAARDDDDAHPAVKQRQQEWRSF
jgi:BioD-like phosphotransacetylase family protein